MIGPIAAWTAWRERREILGDIRRQKADDAEKHYFMVRDNLTYALSAIETGDSMQATELWTKSLELYPKQTRSSPLAIKVLLGLRRFDEAESLMTAGRKRHPDDPQFAAGLADVARVRGDHDSAIERYAGMRKRFPGVLAGYVFGAEGLVKKARIAEAEILVQQAMARFPREIGGFLGYARIAVHQKDWAEAVRRWQLIRDEFNHELSYIGMAQAMTGLGRFDEAEAVLSQARARFPTSGEIYAEMARTAQASGDVAEALVRWTRLVERFPLFMYGYFQAAEAMEALGERATANTILIEAIDRFHTESRPLDEFSNLIRRRGDQHAAVEAWSALRQACPFNEQAYIRGADALSQAGRREESEALLAEYRLRFNR